MAIHPSLDGRCRLHEAHVDVTTLRLSDSPVQSGRQRLIRVQASHHVDDEKTDPVRCPIVSRIDRHEPRECLHDRVGAGLFPVGTLLSVAAHRDIEHTGVACPDGRVSDAQPIRHAGSEPFDDDVGFRGQRLHDVAPFGVLEIQADAALTAVGTDIEHRMAVVISPELARPVTSGRLDLDDIGAVKRH
jgi:hypothetical protein